MRKGHKAGYQYLLIFTQCFKKPFCQDHQKSVFGRKELISLLQGHSLKTMPLGVQYGLLKIMYHSLCKTKGTKPFKTELL